MKKFLKLLLIGFAVACLIHSLPAQTINDLSACLDSGKVLLTKMTGKGISSGLSIKGKLVNMTKEKLYIDVQLKNPLFLINSGSGQNMIASQIYINNGEYSTDGKRRCIILDQADSLDIGFVAYCSDFDKENPSSGESFTVRKLPDELKSVMEKIRLYALKNPHKDFTIAAQLAIWLTSGVKTEDIKMKFPFSEEDYLLSVKFTK